MNSKCFSPILQGWECIKNNRQSYQRWRQKYSMLSVSIAYFTGFVGWLECSPRLLTGLYAVANSVGCNLVKFTKI